MNVSLSMKQAVTIWIGQTLAVLDRQDLFERIKVRWNTRYTSKMGSARWDPHGHHLVQFSAPLWPRATPKERHETVIHEVCHIVAHQNSRDQGGGKVKTHGPEWQTLMRRCGVKPERTHNVSNEGLSRRCIEIKCKCQTIRVTKYIAGRIAAGAIYRCRSCKMYLEAPPGTKPVERRRRRRRAR